MRFLFLFTQWSLFVFAGLLSFFALVQFASDLTSSSGFGLANVAFMFGSLTLLSVSAIGLNLLHSQRPLRKTKGKSTRVGPPFNLPTLPPVGADAPAGEYVDANGQTVWHTGGPAKAVY